MARTDRTRPDQREIRRAAVGKLRSGDAGVSLLQRIRLAKRTGKSKLAKRLERQFSDLARFEDTLPIDRIGRVKR